MFLWPDAGGPPAAPKGGLLTETDRTLKEFAHATTEPLSRAQLLLVGRFPGQSHQEPGPIRSLLAPLAFLFGLAQTEQRKVDFVACYWSNPISNDLLISHGVAMSDGMVAAILDARTIKTVTARDTHLLKKIPERIIASLAFTFVSEGIRFVRCIEHLQICSPSLTHEPVPGPIGKRQLDAVKYLHMFR